MRTKKVRRPVRNDWMPTLPLRPGKHGQVSEVTGKVRTGRAYWDLDYKRLRALLMSVKDNLTQPRHWQQRVEDALVTLEDFT